MESPTRAPAGAGPWRRADRRGCPGRPPLLDRDLGGPRDQGLGHRCQPVLARGVAVGGQHPGSPDHRGRRGRNRPVGDDVERCGHRLGLAGAVPAGNLDAQPAVDLGRRRLVGGGEVVGADPRCARPSSRTPGPPRRPSGAPGAAAAPPAGPSAPRRACRGAPVPPPPVLGAGVQLVAVPLGGGPGRLWPGRSRPHHAAPGPGAGGRGCSAWRAGRPRPLAVPDRETQQRLTGLRFRSAAAAPGHEQSRPLRSRRAAAGPRRAGGRSAGGARIPSSSTRLSASSRFSSADGHRQRTAARAGSVRPARIRPLGPPARAARRPGRPGRRRPR